MKRNIFSLFAAVLLIFLITTSAAAVKVHSGTVKETTNAGGYTYMLIEKDNKQQWVAIPQTAVQVGDKVNYIHGMVMENFGSKTLNRTFDKIIFSEGLTDSEATDGKEDMFASALEDEQEKEHKMETSAGSEGAVTPFRDEKVEKATGDNAYTIEELFAKREELNGKTVKVRGKVVKINMQIMGRNWVHLQDGTGNPMNNSHDLVVTTLAEPKEDSVVTMQGKVAINQDFGYSYKYDLLIEQAEITQ